MEASQIAALREEIGDSAEQFGARVGVTGNTVRRWEAGTVTPGPYWRRKLREIRREFDLEKAKVS